ncbi:hypothetical protein [Methanoplanus endosymbiosus]|uniref:Uncharacterized protein n=1 Tax=Methanoplanus endosymbiosus TaxID=33865 RepID=A0A9E7THW3_9EURY|nr:hypothetical protein [Methanoplanus endosymbiosus]UUX91348.1 hypothetical protein L6E24_08135 [Methanoplanus endosymbiosus]
METEIYLPSNYLLMNMFRIAVTGICIAATAFLGIINPLFIGFGVIITGTIIMAFVISDSGKKVGERPIIIPYVSDDKRKIVLTNIGNKPAFDVKGEIKKKNISFSAGNIEPDGIFDYSAENLERSANIYLSYKSEDGKEFTGTHKLIFGMDEEYDPTKPMFNMFGD